MADHPNSSARQILRAALMAIASKAHEFDQTGPKDDNRFLEIEDLANAALTAAAVKLEQRRRTSIDVSRLAICDACEEIDELVECQQCHTALCGYCLSGDRRVCDGCTEGPLLADEEEGDEVRDG